MENTRDTGILRTLTIQKADEKSNNYSMGNQAHSVDLHGAGQSQKGAVFIPLLKATELLATTGAGPASVPGLWEERRWLQRNCSVLATAEGVNPTVWVSPKHSSVPI